MIWGPKLDANTRTWRRKFNKELIEETEMTPIKYYIRGQRIQWFGHIMRGSDDKINKRVLSWKPTGKRPRGRPRKRWIDAVEGLNRIGVNDWRNIVLDREKWHEVVMAGKTLVEWIKPEEKITLNKMICYSIKRTLLRLD